jgi:DNA-binding NarL/FixJ family response regulator
MDERIYRIVMTNPIPDALIRSLGRAPLVRHPRWRCGAGRAQRPVRMTPALYETLKLAARGKTSPEIAATLAISLVEAKDRVKRLLAFFDARNRTELAAIVFRERIV